MEEDRTETTELTVIDVETVEPEPDVDHLPDALLPDEPTPSHAFVPAPPKTFRRIGEDAQENDEPTNHEGTNGRRLSYEEIAQIVRFKTEGKLTQKQIAQRLACNQSTISRVLQAFGDNRDYAKVLLHNKAPEMIEKIVGSANTENLIDVSKAIGVIPERQRDSSNRGPAINVFGNVSQLGIKIDVPFGED